MPEDNEPPPASVQVKVSFRVPQRMPTLYAHHMMIQPGESEVLLSFFEVIPPLVFEADDEEKLKKLQEVGVVAECVARVTVSRDRFPSFAKAMYDILEQVTAQAAEEESAPKDANDNRDNPES